MAKFTVRRTPEEIFAGIISSTFGFPHVIWQYSGDEELYAGPIMSAHRRRLRALEILDANPKWADSFSKNCYLRIRIVNKARRNVREDMDIFCWLEGDGECEGDMVILPPDANGEQPICCTFHQKALENLAFNYSQLAYR